MAATDTILFLVMLVGLLRIRYYGGATFKFGVAHLLWKQVPCYISVVVVISVH